MQYSSLAAFIAHYELLKSAKALTEEERARLDIMNDTFARLEARDRYAIDSADTGVTPRHRERAERSLARELTTRGILSD